MYAVAALSAHPDDMVAVDSAECGELVSAAHAPQKDAAHAVTQRVCKAARRGRPEGHCSDGLVHLEIGSLALFGGEEGRCRRLRGTTDVRFAAATSPRGSCSSARSARASTTARAWTRRSSPCPRAVVLPRVRTSAGDSRFSIPGGGALRGTKLDLVTRGLPTPDGELGSTRAARTPRAGS